MGTFPRINSRVVAGLAVVIGGAYLVLRFQPGQEKSSLHLGNLIKTSSQHAEPAKTSSQHADPAKTTSQPADPAKTTSQHADPAKTTLQHADPAKTSSQHADPAKTTSQPADPAKTTSQHADPAKTTSQRAYKAMNKSTGSRDDKSDQQGSTGTKTGKQNSDQAQTSDNWPVFSKKFFPGPIPRSPYYPEFNFTWDFNTTEFLLRPDVKSQTPKLMTWMVKPRWLPPLPELVRLRVCPEMPCRMTTNTAYRNKSAALLWFGQNMQAAIPPVRSHPDQVYVFQNNEPQKPDWTHAKSFRLPSWKSAFNWTMTYRADSDIQALYGYMVRRKTPARKNYTDIVARKTQLAAQMVSHCKSMGRREDYVQRVQTVAPVHVYGGCGPFKCARSDDDACLKRLSQNYKFYFAFENAFCTDYISEKFFRFMGADFVVVARASNQFKNHVASGTFINTADFATPEALARHLLYLDSHPEEYVKILQAKDRYQALYEDWPIRNGRGNIGYMEYAYQAVSFCDMCRRLWDLEIYRKTIPDFVRWFDKGNCYPPPDLELAD